MTGAGQRVAIITGGSQGLGAGLVAAYRRRDWAVVANSRTIKPSEDGAVLTISGDIFEPATTDRIIGSRLLREARPGRRATTWNRRSPGSGTIAATSRQGGSPHTARPGPDHWPTMRSCRHRSGPASHGDATAGEAFGATPAARRADPGALVTGHRAHCRRSRPGHHDRGSSEFQAAVRVVED